MVVLLPALVIYVDNWFMCAIVGPCVVLVLIGTAARGVCWLGTPSSCQPRCCHGLPSALGMLAACLPGLWTVATLRSS